MCTKCTEAAVEVFRASRPDANGLLKSERDTLLAEICDKLDPFGMDGNVPALLGISAALILASCKPESTRRPWYKRVHIRFRRVKPAPMLRVTR